MMKEEMNQGRGRTGLNQSIKSVVLNPLETEKTCQLLNKTL